MMKRQTFFGSFWFISAKIGFNGFFCFYIPFIIRSTIDCACPEFSRLFHSLNYHTTLSKYEYQVVCTIQKLADKSYFFHPVSEVFLFYDCSEFKRVFHITSSIAIFFVTKLFVVYCKGKILFYTNQILLYLFR